MDRSNTSVTTETTKTSGKIVKKQLNRLLRLIDKYKTLGAALGVILTCYWNLLCDLFYRGYGSRLEVDSLYIHNDSRSLLISILAFLCGFSLLIPFANKIANQLDKNGTRISATVLSFLKSLGLSALWFAVIVGLGVMTGFQIIIEVVFIPALLFVLSFAMLMVFFLQFIILIVSKLIQVLKKCINNKKTKSNTPSDADDKANKQDTNSACNPKPNINVTFVLIILLILVALIMAVFFYAGQLSASQKKEFAFIVNDFKNEIILSDTVQYNLILSETDEYYCLSAYTITNKDEIGKVTVYTGHQTIISKSEINGEIKIVKKNFDESEIKNDTPPT